MRRVFWAGVLAMVAAGCSSQPQASAPPAEQAAALDAVVMAEKPAHTVGVRDALAKADGDKVVVTGRTPGETVKPFNTAVASFLLMAPEDLDDEAIKDELACDDAAT